MIGRLAAIALGITVFSGNHMGPPPDTLFGYFVPDSLQKLAFDLLRLGIDVLSVWMVYRGIAGTRRGSVAAPEQV